MARTLVADRKEMKFQMAKACNYPSTRKCTLVVKKYLSTAKYFQKAFKTLLNVKP